MEWLKVVLLSAVPLIEMKGAIPLGIYEYHINPIAVFLLSFFGSLLPVPFVLIFFNKIFDFLGKYKFFSGFYNLIDRKISKNKAKFEKFEEIALITFIAIPLPTTGVWTGTAIAAFLKLDFKRSVMCAVVGSFLCGVIITGLAVAAPAFLKML
ncbi:small multi-drug export protein [Clostridium tagluense]|uniref:COG2426 family protein n=1 Tax=Clostridium TaxID=1485 RepID=UPI0013E99D9E|nr:MULTISPECIES: small multi-drug export protein [Clostridium]MBU3126911.1 small multi-drug export protein [Clostridium tagluense]MBW9155612.1 small multi-drug export protein [Clostridium tagluense]MBZ9625429.1 small multi-drug export protein [Clostridium sp. FP2]MCB2310586.1 small multi-drug export protein [Clostridium tagluense]MCB2315248.1 small multi-drug export protein [Clostridium tagluense]